MLKYNITLAFMRYNLFIIILSWNKIILIFILDFYRIEIILKELEPRELRGQSRPHRHFVLDTALIYFLRKSFIIDRVICIVCLN